MFQEFIKTNYGLFTLHGNGTGQVQGTGLAQ